MRSSEIRAAISGGDLKGAADLLGRPVTLRGELRDGSVEFDWPLALPSGGTYRSRIGGVEGIITITDGRASLDLAVAPESGPIEVQLLA